MPTEEAHKMMTGGIKVKQLKEGLSSERFTEDADGYKRAIRKKPPEESPFSQEYVDGYIEAGLMSACHILDDALSVLKNSGLNRIYLDSAPRDHIYALLDYALILGCHMLRGDKDGSHLKKYVSKINTADLFNKYEAWYLRKGLGEL